MALKLDKLSTPLIYLCSIAISYYISLSWIKLLTCLAAVYITRSVLLSRQRSRLRHDLLRQMNARSIPAVKGKLPLNFDILLSWLHHADEDVGRLFQDLSQRYGPTFNTRVLGEDQILSLDPEVFDAVMKDQFKLFYKGPKFRHRAKGLLGHGIFNSDGEQWAKHRRTLRPFFTQETVPYTAIKDLLNRAIAAQPFDKPFDAQILFGDVALDIALIFITGSQCLQDLTNREGWPLTRRSIGNALAESQQVMARRLKVGSIWPLFELRGDGLKGPAAVLRQFFRPLIARAIHRRDQCDPGVSEKGKRKLQDRDEMSLLEQLVYSANDDAYIEEQLINVLLAARDTTTSLLTFLTYTMIHEKAEFARVRREMIRSGLLDEMPGDGDLEEDLSDCEESDGTDCISAFILETIRLFPPVPLNIRRAAQNAVLPGGLFVPEGVSVVLSTINMQRSKTYWGDDAEKFRLDRMRARAQRGPYRAFNIGPRQCPGQNMALSVARTWLEVVSVYLNDRDLDIKLASDAQPAFSRVPQWWTAEAGDGRGRGGMDAIWPVSDIILTVKGGLWVVLRDMSRRSGNGAEL